LKFYTLSTVIWLHNQEISDKATSLTATFLIILTVHFLMVASEGLHKLVVVN